MNARSLSPCLARSYTGPGPATEIWWWAFQGKARGLVSGFQMMTMQQTPFPHGPLTGRSGFGRLCMSAHVYTWP